MQGISVIIDNLCFTNSWYIYDIDIKDQWPLLLTWFNFNPSMDK